MGKPSSDQIAVGVPQFPLFDSLAISALLPPVQNTVNRDGPEQQSLDLDSQPSSKSRVIQVQGFGFGPFLIITYQNLTHHSQHRTH